MHILGEARLSKGQLSRAGLGKELGQGPTGTKNRGENIFDNPRLSILPSSAPDPKIVSEESWSLNNNKTN